MRDGVQAVALAIRIRRGLSRQSLASVATAVGVSPQYLHDVENGRRTIRGDTRDRLVQWLGLDPDLIAYAAGELPEGMRGAPVPWSADDEPRLKRALDAACEAFRREWGEGSA